MRINNNLMAMNTHRQLGVAGNNGAKSMEKLSSGYRINRAGDDAAGLAISEKMRGQIRGLGQASRNAQDAISLVQTAEGALNETQAILQRMRELAVQSSTDTNVDVDRDALQNEINQLATEITRISETTEFNTQSLLSGDFKGTFHIGANEGQNMKLEIGDMSAQALKVSGSGEGKATFELEATDEADFIATANTNAISAGENEFNVVELDNIAMADGTIANYGLSNEAGDIVAVSTDGQEYEFLDDAYSVGNLALQTPTASSIDFGHDVTSGKVTFTATDDGTNYDLTNITATSATINVEGLATGDYTVADFDSSVHLTDVSFHATNSAADSIEQVLLDADNNVVAVKFNDADSSTYVTAGDFYAISDLDLTADVGGTAELDDTVIASGVDALFTKDDFAEGDSFSVKADGGIDISTQETASAAITTINDALESVSAERSKLGAVQNRLEHTIKNLDTSAENLQASESRIRDVDMAKEMMEQTKQQILQQASTAMLAQANTAPQTVLQLLR